MENKCICPLCSSSEKCKTTENGYYSCYHCDHYGVDFYLHTSILDISDEEIKEKIFDLITEFLLEKPQYESKYETEKWRFNYYPEQTEQVFDKPSIINTAKWLPAYPVTIQEKFDRILLNLYRQYPNYDDLINLFWYEHRLIFAHTTSNHGTAGFLRIMCDMGLLTERENDFYAISAQGWQRINELQAHKTEKKHAFVAMAFKEETQPIREAIRSGIENSGFSATLIDEKEHNNQIVPEIFHEIEKSSFLVVDVTYPNYGAYYEAGFALGKGKEVIFCCRQEEFNQSDTRPHFDVAQKSMIVWKDEEDLAERLKKRIEATVK